MSSYRSQLFVGAHVATSSAVIFFEIPHHGAPAHDLAARMVHAENKAETAELSNARPQSVPFTANEAKFKSIETMTYLIQK